MQIANKHDLLATKDNEIAKKEDLLLGAKKTIDRQIKKLSTVRMPTSTRQREVFVAFVKASENLIVPVRRKEVCMPPREKELGRAGFVPANVEVANVPNARYLWSDALAVMKKQGLMTPCPIRCNKSSNKFIRAYKMSKGMCVEGVISELECSEEEGAWLKQVTASAGRLSRSQALMDKYMKPKNGEILESDNGHIELTCQ